MEISLTYSKGDCVALTDNHNETFKGEIKSINPKLGRIVLTNLTQLPERKSIVGCRNFDKHEIAKIKPYEEIENLFGESKSSGEVEAVGKPLVKIENLVLSNIKRLQKEYHYIKNLGTNFFKAISLMNSSGKIGICVKDVSKGRLGRASVLAVSTSSSLFIFDLTALGDEGLEKGLKSVLESSKIIKILHDSRLVSDCLKHSHLIGLENVRDVEAEDIMLVFEERRMIRRHSRSLEYLVEIYLGVETKGCDAVGEIWNERPLAPDLVKSLICDVSYLIPLQEAIETKFLQRLVDASEIYKNYLSKLDFYDFLHGESKKTLAGEMIKLVAPHSEVRGVLGARKKV